MNEDQQKVEKFYEDVARILAGNLDKEMKAFGDEVIPSMNEGVNELGELAKMGDIMALRVALDNFGEDLLLRGDSLQLHINQMLEAKGYDMDDIMSKATVGEEWVKNGG